MPFYYGITCKISFENVDKGWHACLMKLKRFSLKCGLNQKILNELEIEWNLSNSTYV